MDALMAFAQTALWIALIVWMIHKFGSRLESLIDAVGSRIQRGDNFESPWLSIETPPASLRSDRTAATTAEGEHGLATKVDIENLLLKKEYPDAVSESIYLVHTASTLRARTPKQPGQYRVRVRVEAYNLEELSTIERVTYRLYNDEFPEPIVATASVMNNFELWLNVYGEFTVVAYAERKSLPPIWMTRYLDLPGRPPE